MRLAVTFEDRRNTKVYRFHLIHQAIYMTINTEKSMTMKKIRIMLSIFLVLVVIVACSSKEEKRMKFFNKGEALYEAGDYIKARLEFSNALQIDPKFADAYYRLGMIEMKQGDLRQAYAYTSKSVELAPENLEWQVELGKILLTGKLFDKALEKAELVLQKEPQNNDAVLLKASVHMAINEDTEATRLLEGLSKKENVAPEVYLLLAEAYKRRNRPSQQELMLKKGVQTHPDSIVLRYAQVRYYTDKKDADSAIAAIKGMIAMEPENIRFQIGLADLYWRFDRRSEANSLLERIASLPPPDEENFILLGQFYISKTEWAAAEKVLNRGLADLPDSFKLRFMLGGLYQQQNQIDKTITFLNECLALKKDSADPNIIETKNRLARIYLSQRKIKDAEAFTDQVLQEVPGNISAMFNKGEILLIKGNGVDAVPQFRAVAKEKPRYLPAHLGLAKAHLLNQEVDLAIDVLRSALKTDGESRELLRLLARAYALKGDHASAEEQLQYILNKHPKDHEVLADLGDVLLASRDLKGAETRYKSAERQTPDDYRNNVRLSRLYYSQGDLEASIREMETALKKKPDSNALLASLIQLYVAQKKFDLAHSACKRRLKNNPEDAFVQNLLGSVYLANRQNQEAENSFKKAIELNPALLPPYMNLARIYYVQKKSAKGIQELNHLVEAHPQHPAPYLTLGWLHELLKDYSQAIRVYESALEKHPDNWAVANNLAFLLCERATSAEDYDRALNLAQGALSMRPESPQVLDTLGWVYFKLGDFENARHLIEQALFKKPNESTLNYHMGMVLYKIGHTDKAQARLTQALKTRADFQGKEEAERVLKELAQKG